MKILFVTDRRVNAGSIQAVAGYVRAGDELGHTVAVYGPPDPRSPGAGALLRPALQGAAGDPRGLRGVRGGDEDPVRN